MDPSTAIASVHLAALYLGQTNKILLVTTKCLPILLLAQRSFKKDSVLGLGLFLSSIGDLLLALDDQRPELFLGGLGVFLLAHICYITSFKTKFTTQSLISAGVVYPALLSLLGVVLVPALQATQPDLLIPVGVYGLVIATMVFRATDAYLFQKGSYHTFMGALVFALSDFLLAYNRFVSPLPRGQVYVMITYFVAQMMLSDS